MSKDVSNADEKNIKNKEEFIAKCLSLMNGLSYGSITIVVQDGKVIQMERNEKLRLK